MTNPELPTNPPQELISKNKDTILEVFVSNNTDEVLDLIRANRDHWSHLPERLGLIDKREDVEKYITTQKDEANRQFAVRDSGGKLVGIASIRMAEGDDETEGKKVGILAYYIDEQSQGKGYATDAAILATQYALSFMGYEQIIAHVLPENSASQKVLEKAGYLQNGTIQKTYWKKTYEFTEYYFPLDTTPNLP